MKIPIFATMPTARIILTLFLFVLAAAGCRPRVADGELYTAERTVQEHPDSALALLRRIDTLRLDRAERARLRVLLSKALNRTGAELASDSLIRPALAYYRRRGSDGDRALAWYYYGCAHRNAGDLDEAIRGFAASLHHAERAAGDPSADRLRASLYHTLGELYTGQKYGPQAEEYFRRAVRLSEAIGDDETRTYSLLMLSAVLYQEHRYGEAIDILSTLLEPAARSGDGWLSSFVDTYLIHYHLFADDLPLDSLLAMRRRIDRPSLAARMKRDGSIAPGSAAVQLYDVVSTLLFVRCGRADSAAYWLRRSLGSLGPWEPGTVGMLRVASGIAQMRGQPDSALYYERRYGSTLDSLYRSQSTQQVAELERRYRDRYELEWIAERHRYLVWIGTLVALLLTGGAASIAAAYRSRLRRRERELGDYVALVESYRTRHDGLLWRLKATDEREQALRSLLDGRFASIREIASTYYQYGDSRRLGEKLRELALSRSTLAEVVRMADLYSDGAVQRLRTELPGWTERSYDFAALVVAGFAPQEISVLLGMTLNGVYTLKSKLKHRIASSDAPSRERFLRFFD